MTSTLVNKEFTDIIENFLINSIPSIDEAQARQVAAKLSSLKAVQSVRRSGKHDINNQLKSVFRKLLRLAEIKRRDSATSTDSAAESTNTSHDETAPTHHQQLIDSVGEEKYNEIINTVRQIRDIRHKSGVWTKFHQDFSQIRTAESKDGEMEEERVSAAKTIPSPIFDVYFRTRLVEAMQLVDAKPPASPGLIRDLDWENMLVDAKVKLQAFRKFERENVSADEDFSFKCGSGLCSFKGNVSM